MLAALTLVSGILLLVLDTVLLRVFGVLVLAPQIAVVLVVYVGIQRSFSLGAVATLIFAAIADLCWGGPRGYYALGLTAAFFLTAFIRVQWQPRRVLTLALISLPMVVVTDTAALVALALFRRGTAPLSALYAVTPLSALLTVAFAVPVIGVLVKLDSIIERRKREAVAL